MDRILVLTSCRQCLHRHQSRCIDNAYAVITDMNVIPGWCKIITVKTFYERLKKEEAESN